MENDPSFIEVHQACYLRLPAMALAYINDESKVKAIVEKLSTVFTNTKLSIYQLCVMFTILAQLSQHNSNEGKCKW